MAHVGFSSRWNEFTAAFSARLRKSSKFISASAVERLSHAADIFLALAEVPIKTRNLQDSVGVRIAQSGRTLSINMLPKMATRPQYFRPEPGTPTQKIWGRQRLSLMMGRATRVPMQGVVAQMLVAAPYAQMANETSRRAGYLVELYNDFTETMYEAVKGLEEMNWKV